MDLSSMLSDDQLAVFGCFFALAVCGLIATLSFRLGPAGVRLANSQRPGLPLNAARNRESQRPQDRRAA